MFPWAFKTWVLQLIAFLLLQVTLCLAGESQDGYIRETKDYWTFGTARVEKRVEFKAGKLLLTQFRNKTSGRQFILKKSPSEVFSLAGEKTSERLSSASGDWKLLGAKQSQFKQGELQLDITVQRGPLTATKTYVIYPGSSVMREWTTFKNTGATPLPLVNPSYIDLRAGLGKPGEVDFYWISGGGFYVPEVSWQLTKEQLDPAKPPRAFDSYDPFPSDSISKLPPDSVLSTDGVDLKILLNGKQVWPKEGWHSVFDPHPIELNKLNLNLEVKTGDRLAIVANKRKHSRMDTLNFDPVITYGDSEVHTASAEFGANQGEKGWRYQQVANDQFVDLPYYDAAIKQWKSAKDATTPYVGENTLFPGEKTDIARVWTAPKSGRIQLQGTFTTPQNVSGEFLRYGFRMGPARYAPWYAFYNRQTRDGLFLSWDYFGHWQSTLSVSPKGTLDVCMVVAGHNQTLQPGQEVSTPHMVSGLFRDDLDEAGNEFHQWQYQYLWDYTREEWFPGIRMLGNWAKGTTWMNPDANWLGMGNDIPSAFRKVFRVATLMRYCGGDVYHRDWGWWDKAGDWNGPDWRTVNNYLRKYDMGLLLYAFIYTVDPQSKIAKERPDWLIKGTATLDLSRPEIAEYLMNQLSSFRERWGDFEWRNDGTPLAVGLAGDDTVLLAQDQGIRKVIEQFLTKYPKCAFQACNAHCNGGGFDYLRYTSALQLTEGGMGLKRNHYASLLYPPDKTSDVCDAWWPDNYEKGLWRGLLCINFDMTGDTWNPEKLEGVRELIGIYHYLHAQGVVGRWVRVYRPRVAGDDPAMYFERLSRDRKRGVIITRRQAPGPVQIWPKGLLPAEKYLISFQESQATEERLGSDLMKDGIRIEKMPLGELIYLNLPMHPGSKLDREPPTAPAKLVKRAEVNMGYPGVELKWEPGRDNNWIAYYEIVRNGQAIDKVAKGTFYFDHSAGADLGGRYEVRTVDGAENRSSGTLAEGPAAPPAKVVDDAPVTGNNLTYSGEGWKHQANLSPCFGKTLSLSDKKGAKVTWRFEGQRVLWGSKLGADCGKAAVRVDDGPAEVVDTYSADDIWDLCVWQKTLAKGGAHTLTIEALGEHHPRSTGDLIHIDGLRAEGR